MSKPAPTRHKKLRVLNIVGTRPEAIKMAPIILAMKADPDRFDPILCVTGQHRELLDQAVTLFGLTVDQELNAMDPNQTLSGLAARLFAALDPLIERERPDWILAQGDTTTVMVAALCAFHRRLKFGHVEAGLRTGDRGRPFPEEVNRRIADLVATAYFAPTQLARRTLLAEGVLDAAIIVSGNTVIDALHRVAAMECDWTTGPLAALPFAAPSPAPPPPNARTLVLVTAHRRESFGEPFREICMAVRDLALRFGPAGVHLVYPVHPNPNARDPAYEILAGVSNVSLIEPLDYLSLVHLMKRSRLILTDSGGIQEEAPGLGVPVLVMREVTERPEGVEAGVVKLVGVSREGIVREASRLLEDPAAHAAMAAGANPYGDGRAAPRILNALLEWPE